MNGKASRRAVARIIAAKLLAEPARRKHWLQVLAAYLLEHNMADDAELVLNDIAHELFEQDRQLLVDVASARRLQAGVLAELTKYLRAATGAKHVVLAERTDPSLLGGLIARTPSQILDTTLRTQLNQLATIK